MFELINAGICANAGIRTILCSLCYNLIHPRDCGESVSGQRIYLRTSHAYPFRTTCPHGCEEATIRPMGSCIDSALTLLCVAGALAGVVEFPFTTAALACNTVTCI